MLRWGGVGWGGVGQDVTVMWTSAHLWCYVTEIFSRLSYIFDATLVRSSLDFHRSLMLRWGGVGWGGARCYRHVNICTSLMQKCGERNCQNVEISKLKTSRSPTLGKTNSKLFKNLHFATAKHTFYKKTLRKWIHFSAVFEISKWQFRYSENQIRQKKSETARAVSGPEGDLCWMKGSLVSTETSRLPKRKNVFIDHNHWRHICWDWNGLYAVDGC